MNPTPGEILRRHWSRLAITLAPPVTVEELTTFERTHDVRLPTELRDYYLAANGFAPPSDQDENGFSFWPLTRVCPVATFDGGAWFSDEAERCFLFADYLSLSWGFAFCVTPDSVHARICIVGTADRRPVWIADGFSKFVELYVRNDERLYSPN
ncbi:MAG: SMI1/KNR4 family protein [Vicinamibacterales bacterium]